jgi:hypothetical protein
VEVTGDCRKLHNEELHDLFSGDQIRGSDGAAGQATRMVEKKRAFRLPVGKPKRKRTFGGLILKWIAKKENGVPWPVLIGLGEGRW